jgi:hypothetical protein
MMDDGNPHLRSARMNDGWLELRIRREAAFYPQVVHVIATLESPDRDLKPAIHDNIRFEADTKSQQILFTLVSDGGITVEPVIPLSKGADAPTLDRDGTPNHCRLQVRVRDQQRDQEYDCVDVAIETGTEPAVTEITSFE